MTNSVFPQTKQSPIILICCWGKVERGYEVICSETLLIEFLLMFTIVKEPAEGNSCGIRIHLNRKKKHHITVLSIVAFVVNILFLRKIARQIRCFRRWWELISSMFFLKVMTASYYTMEQKFWHDLDESTQNERKQRQKLYFGVALDKTHNEKLQSMT